jgi:gluconolactonase
MNCIHYFAGGAIALLGALPTFAQRQAPPVADAIVDLRRGASAALVGGPWRYHDAEAIEVEHRDAGPDRRASGAPNRTRDISPKAGARDFDDSGWPALAPEQLEERRTKGRLSFGWYRFRVQLPAQLESFSVAGSTAVFEIVVDDYAEVWVDGKLPQVLGARGGALPAGWNAPNRVVLTRDARPGEQFQIAVFAANGPLSDPPPNFVWVRSATLDFYAPGRFDTPQVLALEVSAATPALDAVVRKGARLERLADGFGFTEGPVWHPAGYLLFSDPNQNVIHRWAPDTSVSVYRTKSGYSGLDAGQYRQPGSNGLALDGEGRLAICEHGNRRVTRLEPNGTLVVLADSYEGKRLNSPNDLVFRSDGALVFTDPPFGLPKFHADPRRELDFCGVFFLKDGKLRLISRELSGPNGVAFSPDERYLYVTNWDEKRKVVMRYELGPDGEASGGAVFFDMTSAPFEEALDGLEVDAAGNLFVSGPGGVWVLSSSGAHLGTLVLPQLPANFAWGGPERRDLYLTARSELYRLRVETFGSGAQRN